MRRAWLIATLLLSFSFSACAHPYQTVIPVDPAEWSSSIALQFAIRRLDDRELVLLDAWFAYVQFTWHRGERIRAGTTIGEAVGAQRNYQRQEHARRQLQERLGRDLPLIRAHPVGYRLSKPSHGSL